MVRLNGREWNVSPDIYIFLQIGFHRFWEAGGWGLVV